MRYQTEAVGETTWLLGELPSGGAVTITLYKLSDSSTPALDSNACTEIGATGIYKWATTNITTPETTKTEYLYAMTDGTLNYFGKIVVGGYVDKINANISTRSSHAAADIWSVGTRALTDKVGFGLSTAGILAIWHQLIANIVTANTIGKLLKDDIDAKVSLVKSQTDKMNFTGTDIKATLDGEKVALSDATEGQIDDIETDLNTPDQYKADVSALALEATLTAMKGATFAEATDSLEALRNRGDIAWLTATGFSTHTAAAIWVAANRALSTPADYKADVSALALEATLTAMKGTGFLTGTDSLEAIRNRGDSAWITGAGGATAEEIRDAILSDATKFAGANIDAKISSRATPADVKVTGGGGGGGGGGTIIERPDTWKPEEKLKLIGDIKKIHKMINELSSLQSVGLQNVKNKIDDFKNSLIKLIKGEVTVLISLKKSIAEQPKTDSSDALADSINQLIAKWGSIQKSILKSTDLGSLDNKLDDLTEIMLKTLSDKTIEELVNG